jgi:flagellar hook-length control protein FliK
MPVVAPSQTAAAQGATADATTGAEGDIDFAAVLKAQFALPAKDAPGTEIIAALMPSQTAEAAEEMPPAEALPVAPDLAALLTGLMPPAAMQTPVDPVQQTDEPAREQIFLAATTNAALATANPAAPAKTAVETPVGQEYPPSAMQSARETTGLADQPVPAEAVTTTFAADPQMPVAAAEHAPPSASASAQAAAPLAHATPAGDAPSVVRVDTPVGNRGWDAEIGQKVVLLVNRQESRAELTLTPPQLGKVEVSITVNGDQTSATFVSASPAAREALEQALPRLREILAEAGITLGQASVNAESTRRDTEESPTEGRGAGRNTDAMSSVDAPTQWVRRSNGLIDTFA